MSNLTLTILFLIFIVCLVLLTISFYKQGAINIVLFNVGLLIVAAIMYFSFRYYNNVENHMYPPTIENVNKGEAHVDTIYTVNNGIKNTTYKIVWN